MIDTAHWPAATDRAVRRAGPVTSVLLRRRYDTSIDDVWRACTQPKRLRRWFAEVAGELHENARLTIDVGMESPVTSTIRRCEPPAKLVITWCYGNDTRDPVDEVELRLTEQDEVTTLELEHRSVAPSDWWRAVGAGWEEWILRLHVLLAGGNPDDISSDLLQQQLAPHWAALSAEN